MREQFRFSMLTLAMFLISVLALVFLLAPFVVLLPNAFSSGNYLQFPPPGYSLRWFENFFGDDFWTRPAVTSIRVATAAAVVATVTGTAAAIALDRWKFRGQNIVVMLLLMPLVVPFVITGIAAYTLFVSLNLYGSSGALIVTHALIGMPYVVLSVAAALSQQDPRLYFAALSLGAGPWRVFSEVTLPLALPGILGGFVLAFVISFDDVVIATFLAGIRTTTLPLRMFHAVEQELNPTVASVSALLIAFAGLVAILFVVLSEFQQRRRTRPRGG